MDKEKNMIKYKINGIAPGQKEYVETEDKNELLELFSELSDFPYYTLQVVSEKKDSIKMLLPFKNKEQLKTIIDDNIQENFIVLFDRYNLAMRICDQESFDKSIDIALKFIDNYFELHEKIKKINK